MLNCRCDRLRCSHSPARTRYSARLATHCHRCIRNLYVGKLLKCCLPHGDGVFGLQLVERYLERAATVSVGMWCGLAHNASSSLRRSYPRHQPTPNIDSRLSTVIVTPLSNCKKYCPSPMGLILTPPWQ